MIAMTGYPRSVPAFSIRRQTITSLRRTSDRRTSQQLGVHPSHANLAGLKS
jgi:hypothetical protein